MKLGLVKRFKQGLQSLNSEREGVTSGITNAAQETSDNVFEMENEIDYG